MAMNPYITDLNIILAFIASLSGFLAGIAVAYLAKEELSDARRHLVLMIHFIFALIVMAFLFGLKLNVIINILLVIISIILSIAIYVFVRNRIIKVLIYYTLFGALYFLSAQNIFILVMQTSFIFLAGLPLGSIFAEDVIMPAKDKIRKILNSEKKNRIKQKKKKNKKN